MWQELGVLKGQQRIPDLELSGGSEKEAWGKDGWALFPNWHSGTSLQSHKQRGRTRLVSVRK